MTLIAVLKMLNASFVWMLFLVMLSMISFAKGQDIIEGQAVSCDSSSPQCCWVKRSWQLMGKTTAVDHTSSTACCSMGGVSCSDSIVTQIAWNGRGLTGSIPPDIGNLTNLTYL
jgi:hypothetical protein